jgi:hypothetical protein
LSGRQGNKILDATMRPWRQTAPHLNIAPPKGARELSALEALLAERG